jgi:hypothetical protein
LRPRDVQREGYFVIGGLVTNRDIMIQILSEASSLPYDKVKNIVDIAYKFTGNKADIDDPVPDEKAQTLLIKLRKEFPGIRQWLLRGNLLSREDIETMIAHFGNNL